MKKKAVIMDLRDYYFLRLAAYPYKKIEHKIIRKKYLKSGEPDKLRRFKNCNRGKRCFIVGNGPSLQVEDLDKLKNEIAIASNRIGNLFGETQWRPTYYFFTDTRAIKDYMPYIESLELPNIFIPFVAKKYETIYHPNWYHIMEKKDYIVFLYNDKSIHISEDITKYFSQGYTVLFAALQFAIYTGMTEIYLLGVDFNYSYVTDKWGRRKHLDGVVDYFDGKELPNAFLNYHSVLYAWKIAKKYCDKHNIKIFNATRGGKLEVFERVDFDSLFE